MNIRQAILLAADHIERNPQLFKFEKVRVPRDCGTPGCALGWIGYFMRLTIPFVGYENTSTDVAIAMGLPERHGKGAFTNSGIFYDRMDSLRETTWMRCPMECAKTLRAYANRFHPAEVNFARDLTARLASLPAIADEVQS